MTVSKGLRAMLDERGVEWEAFDDFEQTTQWSTHNGAFVYWARERNGKLLVETATATKCCASCTPEQAIAATLGPGTLTAEQVSNAIYAHSIHADCADADWQAVADELNGMLNDADATPTRQDGANERDQLKAENAKLRKLICNYSEAAKYLCKTFGSCRKCNLDCASWFGSDKKQNEMDCARTLLDMEARELEVEVDG